MTEIPRPPAPALIAAAAFALLVAVQAFGPFGFDIRIVAVEACLGVAALALLRRSGRSPADVSLWLVFILVPVEFLTVVAGAKHLVERSSAQIVLYHLAGWQLVWAGASIVFTVLERKELRRVPARILGGITGIIAGLAGGGLAVMMGIGHGRPLRMRGQQLHPKLKRGSDWTRGARPDGSALDEATRSALEALWLHDARTEHASVPAFSRLAWLLTAVGAPPELLAWAHRAALEEIDHAQRCFALAAGYAGRSFTVAAMPELLSWSDQDLGDPLVTLAVESLFDGCQLEGFNADVAGRAAAVCKEPVTGDVLARIARDERSHAELSWAVLAWAMEQDRARVLPELERALARLDEQACPRAVSAENVAVIARAHPQALRDHGRLPDAEWAEAWSERTALTKARAQALLRGYGATCTGTTISFDRA